MSEGHQEGEGPIPGRTGSMSPGDEVPKGTDNAGPNICATCGGSGKIDSGETCPTCEGTGVVMEAVGGA